MRPVKHAGDLIGHSLARDSDDSWPMRTRRPSRLPRLPGPADGLAIGLMGGSFDPPHAGHAHVIETAMRRLGLDWVWVIPAPGNPLKRTATPFADRMAAAKRRFAGPRVRVSAIEAELGSTYTIDLVRALKRRAPRSRLVLIIGSDNLSSFHRWRRWRELARLVPIAVVARPAIGQSAASHAGSPFARAFAGARLAEAKARRLSRTPPPAWVYLHAPLDRTSSTALRTQTPPV
jgi:nicotinate-nucleotide adenylyltransferase